MRYIGLFKWYDQEKGFGVISTLFPQITATEDVFCHCSNIEKGTKVALGIPVTFEVKQRAKGGYAAKECRSFIGSLDEWKFLFNNKGINLVVKTDTEELDVLTIAIGQISTTQAAQNFINAYQNWSKKQDVIDKVYFINATKESMVEEIQEFVKDLVKDLTINDKWKYFKHCNLGLNYFTDDECLQLADNVTKAQYISIAKLRPNIYTEIVEQKIKRKLVDFSFDFKVQDSWHQTVKSEYDVLSELYKDYCCVATEIQQTELQKVAGESILLKGNLFKDKTKALIGLDPNYSRFVSQFKYLVNFPPCIPTTVQDELKSLVVPLIKQSFEWQDVLKMMVDGFLPVDNHFIQSKFKHFDKKILELICLNTNVFDNEFIGSLLFDYLSITHDIDTVISIYQKKRRIQTPERTETIKNCIEECFANESVGFVQNAYSYIGLLGENFIYTITERYFLFTHDSEPLLKQINKAEGEFGEKIEELLFEFHINHPEWIDDNFVRPFCLTSIDTHPRTTHEYVVQLLKLYCNNTKNYKQTTIYASHYSSEAKIEIENYLVSVLTREEYMLLWEESVCNILPNGYIDDYFDDREYRYLKANEWLSLGKLTENQLRTILVNILKNIQGVMHHKCFKTEYNVYKFLKEKHWKEDYESIISDQHILLFEHADNLIFDDFNEICRIFALFPDSVQVRLFKYIFLCIKKQKFSIKAIDLLKLNDSDEAYRNCPEEDKPIVCLSVSIIIESLISYDKNKTFITDKDFYKLVYVSVAHGKKELSPIGDFFDKCTGKRYRRYPDLDNVRKFIYPIQSEDGRVWYIINFPYDGNLVENVKNITGRRYHPKYQVWFAPDSSSQQVKDFAMYNGFVLIEEVKPKESIGHSFSQITQNCNQEKLRDILHDVASLENSHDNMPNFLWCEGRESQTGSPDVWWCVGHHPCNACAIVLHSTGDWEKYTLFDFCKILGYDLHEQNKYGHFKAGQYALFITSINRFNKLLERLTCKECGDIIYPIEDNYSVNGASSFHCTNGNCGMYHQVIYLNHCYTRKCRGVIDSREGARCPNGLVICKACGTCCSTEMFQYRLDRLRRAGSNFISPELIHRIQDNAGHANQGQYFCYKCGNAIDGKSANRCNSCGAIINYKDQ